MLYSCCCSKFWASRSRQCWRLHASADDLDDGDHNDQYEDDSDGVADEHDQYDRGEHGKYKINFISWIEHERCGTEHTKLGKEEKRPGCGYMYTRTWTKCICS